MAIGSTVMTAVSQRYRDDIDGLRAIAVLAVLAFHYGAPLKGGFTRVDVFFVISGFLITQQIVSDIEEGSFSVAGFYARRMRRILPALLTMLTVCLFAGRFLLLPGDYKSAAASGAAATFGASNFYFLFNTGYFDRSSELLPFLHTWSLGVEEQFYLVWPMLLFALRGRGGRFQAVTTFIAISTSMAAATYLLEADPKAAFYMAIPRAWELGAGALLVFMPRLNGMTAAVASAVGLLFMATGFFVADPASFPGPSALSCVGAALVIWPRQTNPALTKGLALLRPIGLISYSLYLWHWPIWVLFRIYNNGDQPTLYTETSRRCMKHSCLRWPRLRLPRYPTG